jgi:peptidoglycan/xylan/chitin deacetylase (PgdA/CDA1 family)
MFGQMYHHFHDDGMHRRGQGSIDAGEFRSLLRRAREAGEILSPRAFRDAVANGTLAPGQTCITFDDALRCQFDIAAPVLAEEGVRAFFFVYSSALDENPDPLEFYRDFRHLHFDSMEDFYAFFFATVKERFPDLHARYKTEFPVDYLAQFRFYSEMDRRFRFFRDQIAGPARYETIMNRLLAEAGYDTAARREALFMRAEHIRELAGAGHEIGLHSHSHPTDMKTLPDKRQLEEYARNKRVLESLTKGEIWSMSHPCGSYDDRTLAVLRGLGIRLGFRHSLHEPRILSPLEVPRENHVNLLRQLSPEPDRADAGQA